MGTLKIGWARRDISTTEPVCIPGQMYIRVSEGIHDPLTATALVLDGGAGQDAAIFVSCDLTHIPDVFAEAVRAKIAERNAEIPAANLVLNATHTHSSTSTEDTPEKTPDGRDIYPGSAYREFCAGQVADAVCEAWNGRKPGGIAYGYGYAVVAHSRRVIYSVDQGANNHPLSHAPNGYGVMYGNTRRDSFSHYEAGADHFLNVMFTVDETEKLTGMILNVPCPSQTSEHFLKLSADYWNEVREGVAAEFGPEVFVLPQCAAAGDLSPRTMHYKEAQVRRMQLKYGMGYDLNHMPHGGIDEYNKAMTERRDIAERILTGVRDVWSWAKKDIQTDVPVRHVAAQVPLSRRTITLEQKEECERNVQVIEDLKPDPAAYTPEEYRVVMSQYTSYKNRNLNGISRYETLQKEPKLACELHVTRVGDIAFASNPFELYQDFMHRIQARSPFIQTFITQLAASSCGYLPSKRGEYNKGYSASIFCNRIGHEGGQELVEYVLETLAALAE